LFGGEGYHERMVSPAFTFNPVTGVTVGSRPRVPDGATYKIHGLFVQDVWSPMASGRVRLSGALRFGGATYRSPGGAGFPTDSLTANAVSGRAGGVVRVAGAGGGGWGGWRGRCLCMRPIAAGFGRRA
jgi:hypothetical protein